MAATKEAFLPSTVLGQESIDPESCAHEFYQCRNLFALKRVLRQADQEWMEGFLGCGGLVAIFDAISVLGGKEVGSVADTVPQLECVECLKAVMNSPYGLECVIRSSSEKFVNKLVLELDTPNILVKMHLFLLLSALCKHSEEGLQATLQALDHYKQTCCQRHRYSVVVQELTSSDDFPEYQAAVLAFVNYLVSSCEDLDARIKIRSELSALALPDILAVLRYSDNECLGEQVRVYEDRQIGDQHEMVMPGGVDITNHEHLFRAVFEKVFDTPQSSSFLHILQHLLLIERDTAKGAAIWSTLENIVDSALTMSGPLQAERVQASAVAKLRKALEDEDVRKKEEDIASPCKETLEREDTAEVEDKDPPEAAPPQAAPPPPPPPPPSFGQKIISAVLSIFDKARQYKPDKKMKKLNWEKVPTVDAKSRNALWHAATMERVKLKVKVQEVDLEMLFSQKAGNVLKTLSTKTHLPNQQKALVVNIVLDTVKCSNDEMIEMLRNGETSSLTLNQACTLLEQMPNEKDIGFLQQFESDPSPLGKTEHFLLKLMHLDFYPLRLKVIKTKLTFEDILGDYCPSLELLHTALDELTSCSALRELFYIILLIGNIINGGTMLGDAYGFKLTSLQRLSATLANVSRPNVNILHYLVTVCNEDCPSLLQFSSDLPHLVEASRISVDTIQEEIDEWKNEIDEFKEMVVGGEVSLPVDLKEQLSVFLPSAEEKLGVLYTKLGEVRDQGKVAAHYFCDDRNDFLDMVFVEVKEFTDEFKKTVKETLKERPIQLYMQLPPPKEEQPPAGAIKRATSVITEPELDFTHLTVPEVIEEEDEQLHVPTQTKKDDIVITDIEVIPPTTQAIRPEPPPSFQKPTYGRRRKPSSPMGQTPSLAYSRQLSLHEHSCQPLRETMYRRGLSFDPGAISDASLNEVARILHKMAQAIQRDIKDEFV